jgi:hypothetical protein
MSVLSEALEFLGLAAGTPTSGDRYEYRLARTREEQRALAEAMRGLPMRFADRLPAQTTQRIRDAAARGHWEHAVDELISALHARGEAVTAEERDRLRALLEALDMPGERVETLLGH